MAKIKELLHAPGIDLVELDACVLRLEQCAKLMDAAPSWGLGGASNTGVAPSRVLDMLPNLPLLHSRTILRGRISGMKAEISWSLGTTLPERNAAVATLEVSCSPALGKVVVQEVVRSDLSNAPGPGDKDAIPRIIGSIVRLQRIVKTSADAIRAEIVGGDPVAASEEAMKTARTIASPFATMAVEDSPEDQPVQRMRLATGSPYGPAALSFQENDWDDELLPMLSDLAAQSLDKSLPRIVGMEIEHTPAGVRYLFGPTEVGVDMYPASEDPIQELRRYRELSAVPRPAWRWRDKTPGEH